MAANFGLERAVRELRSFYGRATRLYGQDPASADEFVSNVCGHLDRIRDVRKHFGIPVSLESELRWVARVQGVEKARREWRSRR